MLALLDGVSASALVVRAIIALPSTMDFDRLKPTVKAMQNVVNDLDLNPTPKVMTSAISGMYRLEIKRMFGGAKADFDPTHHFTTITSPLTIRSNS